MQSEPVRDYPKFAKAVSARIASPIFGERDLFKTLSFVRSAPFWRLRRPLYSWSPGEPFDIRDIDVKNRDADESAAGRENLVHFHASEIFSPLNRPAGIG